MAKKKAQERTITFPNNGCGGLTVLGLDCSSSTVGWGLVGCRSDGTQILLAHGHIKPLTSKYDFMERLSNLFDRISSLCEKFKPSIVAVEDILVYVRGSSSARTITILAAFNRVAALAAFRCVGHLRLYAVHEIRRILKIACGLNRTPEKEQMPNLVRAHLEPRFSDIMKLRGNGVADTTCDEADGIAVAWACALDIRSKV